MCGMGCQVKVLPSSSLSFSSSLFFLFRIFREQDAPSPRPGHHHTNAFTLQVSDFAEEKETKLDEAQLKEIVSSIGQSTAKEVAAKASITAQLLWTVPKCSPLNAS